MFAAWYPLNPSHIVKTIMHEDNNPVRSPSRFCANWLSDTILSADEINRYPCFAIMSAAIAEAIRICGRVIAPVDLNKLRDSNQ